MKKYIFFFAISLCLGSCAFWNSISGVIHFPQYTVGTIIDAHILQHSGASSLCEYSVNGVTHRINGPYYSGSHGKRYVVVGEKYMIKYDSLHTGFSEVLKDQPVFLPEENVTNSIGVINHLSKTCCTFIYLSKGQNLFDKLQIISKGTLEKYPQLKVGSIFEIKFDPNNPQRSVIYLDKPSSDTLQKLIICNRLNQQKSITMSEK